MAKWHVKDVTSKNINVVAHFLIPAGNNAVGKTWKAQALLTGLTGNAASTFADAGEIDSIESGDTGEVSFSLPLDLSQTLPAQLNDVIASVERKITKTIAEWQSKLNYSGYSNGAVE